MAVQVMEPASGAVPVGLDGRQRGAGGPNTTVSPLGDSTESRKDL